MKNANITNWMNNKNYQDFKRQIATDIYVAKKNGVHQEDIALVLKELSKEIVKDISKLN